MTDTHLIITVEQHKQLSRMELAKKALQVLKKHYPTYNWCARAEGLTTIGISETKYIPWGENYAMFIHDKDWANIHEFETLVVKFAGEWLERGNQSRVRNNKAPLDRLPDGFDPRFNKNQRTSKMKIVGPNGESIEQLRAQYLARIATGLNT
jgi:hypothetical protein